MYVLILFSKTVRRLMVLLLILVVSVLCDC